MPRPTKLIRYCEKRSCSLALVGHGEPVFLPCLVEQRNHAVIEEVEEILERVSLARLRSRINSV